MPRKKLSNPEDVLNRPIIIRINETVFKRLEKLQKERDCGSVGFAWVLYLIQNHLLVLCHPAGINHPLRDKEHIPLLGCQ